MKQFFKSIFRFYIEASIHVALAVFALFKGFLISYNLNIDLNLSLVIFLSTITGYNFVKYAPIAKLHHRSLARFLKLIQLFSLVSFIILIFVGLKLPFRTLSVFAVGGILVFLYAIPVALYKNLRSMAGIKIYVVALSWVLTVIIVPAIHYRIPINLELILKALQVYALVLALIIPFDIRDLNYDKKDLRTLPQVIGVKKSKYLGSLLMFSFWVISFNLEKPETLIVTGLISILYSIMIYRTHSFKSKYYCSFYIESIPIVYWTLLELNYLAFV